MSLKTEIDQLSQRIGVIEQQLIEQRKQLQALMSLRFDCKHNFIPPHPNYAHEGGTCSECGINEVFWACNKR